MATHDDDLDLGFLDGVDDEYSSDDLFLDGDDLSCASPCTTDEMSSEPEDMMAPFTPGAPPPPVARPAQKPRLHVPTLSENYKLPAAMSTKKAAPMVVPQMGNGSGTMARKPETAPSNASAVPFRPAGGGSLLPPNFGPGLAPAFMFNLQLATAAMAQQQAQAAAQAAAKSSAQVTGAVVAADDSDTDDRPSAAARVAAAAKAAERKRLAFEAKEEQRRRNRAAADRSRNRRRALLSSLPAEKEALESRVRDLEQGLAASQAEAQSLKDQVGFLRSLLAGGAGAAAFATSKVSGAINDGRAAAAAAVADGTVALTPSNVMLLAVACVLTVNECGAAFFLSPTNGLGFGGFDGDDGSAGGGRGGRVLLSLVDLVDDDSRARFLPRAVTDSAALVGLVLFARLVVLGAWHTLKEIAARAADSTSCRRRLPLWGGDKDHAN